MKPTVSYHTKIIGIRRVVMLGKLGWDGGGFDGEPSTWTVDGHALNDYLDRIQEEGIKIGADPYVTITVEVHGIQDDAEMVGEAAQRPSSDTDTHPKPEQAAVSP